MKRGYSKLLIEDLVLPDQGADLRQASVDMTMYFVPGGIERTRGQWERLLDGAGLRINGIWFDEGGMEGVVEAELKDEDRDEVESRANGEGPTAGGSEHVNGHTA